MKPSTNLLITCIVLVLGLASSSTSNAQTQGEMNRQSQHDFEAADAELNKVYKELVGAVDKQSQAKLRAAQIVWIAFRDAQATLEADLEARGGTMAPTVYNVCRTTLTDARTSQLAKLRKDYGH